MDHLHVLVASFGLHACVRVRQQGKEQRAACVAVGQRQGPEQGAKRCVASENFAWTGDSEAARPGTDSVCGRARGARASGMVGRAEGQTASEVQRTGTLGRRKNYLLNRLRFRLCFRVCLAL